MCVSIELQRILFTFFQVRFLFEYHNLQVDWLALKSVYFLTISYRDIFGPWIVPMLIIFHPVPTPLHVSLSCFFATRCCLSGLPHQTLFLADFQLGPANGRHQKTLRKERGERLGFSILLFSCFGANSGNGFSLTSTATRGGPTCTSPVALDGVVTSSHCCRQHPLLVLYP